MIQRYKIRIDHTPGIEWDEVCYWAMNQFGAPGPWQRFDYDTTEDYMDFLFVNEQDAIMFTLKWVGNERKTSTLR